MTPVAPPVRIGIDLGGTKIEGIALDGAGRTQVRRRIAAPRGDYAHTLDAVVSLVNAIERDVGTSGTVGIGIPGTVSESTGLVKNANSTWIIGQPLTRDLSRLLGREVRAANDANCFVLSEATDGAAAGAEVVFGVIIGTGTGGGLAVDGRVIAGANGVAGEWGHNAMPWPTVEEWPGPPCYCGRTGCIETFLSGPGLSRDYEAAGQGDSGVKASIDAVEIAARAVAGEAAATACLVRYEERMARALASLINVVDPDVIVLGGGLSKIERLYDRVPAQWGRYVFSDTVDTRLVKAAHGDSSGVRGAAWLWSRGT